MTFFLVTFTITTGIFFIVLIIILILWMLSLTITSAPFVPLPHNVVPRVVTSLGVQKGDVLFDLGCGDGRVLIGCYQNQPNAAYIGIDKALVPVWLARLKVKLHGFTAVASSHSSAEPAEAHPPSHEASADYPHHIPPRAYALGFLRRRVKKINSSPTITIIRKNFFSANLSQATHVFLYLFPKLMDRLLPKLEQELKPGTRVVSCDFPFSKKQPVEVIPLNRPAHSLGRVLYVYKF